MKSLALLAVAASWTFVETPVSAQSTTPTRTPASQPDDQPSTRASPGHKKKGRVEISPVYGYKWWGTLEVRGGELKIENSPTYGGVINIQSLSQGKANSMIELSYMRQDTKLTMRRDEITSKEVFGFAVEHFQIGGLGEIVQPAGGARNIVPFTVGTMGFTRYTPRTGYFDDEYRVSATFGMGLKIKFHSRVGIRFHGRVIATLLNTSKGLFCGPNSCAVRVAGAAIYQSELSGALIIAL